MKTTTIETKTEFKTIEVFDAIIVAPLMDKLIRSINSNKAHDNYVALSEEERNKYYYPIVDNVVSYEIDSKIYRTLTELGFCPTGEVDLLPNGDELKLKPIKL